MAKRFETIELDVVELDGGSHYDMSVDYFRFMFADGVEPTNNHSEQQIRHCVIDRRITGGTRSAVGQRYHERMWTAIATCTKQSRSFFHFLHTSIDATSPAITPHPSCPSNRIRERLPLAKQIPCKQSRKFDEFVSEELLEIALAHDYLDLEGARKCIRSCLS